MSICHIVCAGPGVLPAFEVAERDLLIAADGGYDKCVAAGLEPDCLIGDFDSIDGGVPDSVSCPCQVLPREKDDTDLMVCVREALSRGYFSLQLHCALGGDLGHTVAVLKTLDWIREQGARAVAFGNGQSAVIVSHEDGEVALAQWAPAQHLDENGAIKAGTRISVSSFGGAAVGVSERGLAWELEDAIMRSSDHYGVSNEVPEGATPRVRVRWGQLLVIIGQ